MTANELLELLEFGLNIAEIKKALKKKIKKNIVWDQISKHVLETKTGWDNIKEDLERLKSLRNKAAHFRVVTEKDLTEARKLSNTIIRKTKKRPRISSKDIAKLKDVTYPLAETLYSARETLAALGGQPKEIAKVVRDANTYMTVNLATDINESMRALRQLLGYRTNGPAKEGNGTKSKSEDVTQLKPGERNKQGNK